METLCSVFSEYYSPEKGENVHLKNTDEKVLDLEFWTVSVGKFVLFIRTLTEFGVNHLFRH